MPDLFLKVSHLSLNEADTAKKVCHIRVALINKGQYGFDTMIIGPRRKLLYQGTTDTLSPVNGVYADNLNPRYESRKTEFEFTRSTQEKTDDPVFNLGNYR